MRYLLFELPVDELPVDELPLEPPVEPVLLLSVSPDVPLVEVPLAPVLLNRYASRCRWRQIASAGASLLSLPLVPEPDRIWRLLRQLLNSSGSVAVPTDAPPCDEIRAPVALLRATTAFLGSATAFSVAGVTAKIRRANRSVRAGASARACLGSPTWRRDGSGAGADFSVRV